MRQSPPTAGAIKFIQYLRRLSPIDDKEIPEILDSVKRLVRVVQKIIVEPQAQITYPERKEKGKTIKTRLIKTDISELAKTFKGNKTSLKPALKDFMNLFKENGRK